LPFTIAEAVGQPLPNLCERLLKARTPKQLEFFNARHSGPHVMERYLVQGGLPGICFFRDAHVRAEKFEAQLDTLLNRDIRQIYPTTLLYSSLRALMKHLARNQGRPFEIADAARASQISRVSLKRLLFALEALFLIRVVPALEGSKPTIFLEDQGMASWLSKHALDSADDIVRGLYANLRQELHYRPELGGHISHWRTRNDAEVPLVFDSRHGRLGLIATTLEEPTPKTLGSARAFLERFPNARVVIAYAGRRVVTKTPSLFWIPYWLLC
jgi:predicted AAA+ superfamily ATPase